MMKNIILALILTLVLIAEVQAAETIDPTKANIVVPEKHIISVDAQVGGVEGDFSDEGLLPNLNPQVRAMLEKNEITKQKVSSPKRNLWSKVKSWFGFGK